MEEPVDYYKLGETAGKAWRLMHMGATAGEVNSAAHKAAERLAEDGTANYRVRQGFFEGSANVDRKAAQTRTRD